MPEITKFIDTIIALRDPKTGCPWNRAQTHGSLKRYLIEEMYECLEVIDAIDELESSAPVSKVAKPDKSLASYNTELCEELGDLLLQILLHARIAEEKGYFSFQDVARTCNEKMILRHPHVFKSGLKASSAEEVDSHWEAAKKSEKASRASIFDGIPTEMPALARAWKISKKAVRESFEWDKEEQLWAQLQSELDEFKEAASAYEAKLSDNVSPELTKLKHEAELEMGDILFTVVNLARWFEIDPEDALRKTNNKFTTRFNKMVEIAAPKQLKDYSSTELEELWQKAKLALN